MTWIARHNAGCRHERSRRGAGLVRGSGVRKSRRQGSLNLRACRVDRPRSNEGRDRSPGDSASARRHSGHELGALNEGRDRSPGDRRAVACGCAPGRPLNEGRDRSPGDSAVRGGGLVGLDVRSTKAGTVAPATGAGSGAPPGHVLGRSTKAGTVAPATVLEHLAVGAAVHFRSTKAGTVAPATVGSASPAENTGGRRSTKAGTVAPATAVRWPDGFATTTGSAQRRPGP